MKKKAIGTVEKNTHCGIFGHIIIEVLNHMNSKLYEVSWRDEV